MEQPGLLEMKTALHNSDRPDLSHRLRRLRLPLCRRCVHLQTHTHTLISHVTHVSERQRQAVRTVTNIISLSLWHTCTVSHSPSTHTHTHTHLGCWIIESYNIILELVADTCSCLMERRVQKMRGRQAVGYQYCIMLICSSVSIYCTNIHEWCPCSKTLVCIGNCEG